MANNSQNISKNDLVADRLHSAAIHLLRTLRLQDEASGIGPARLSALSILVFVGPQSLGELAEMEQVKPPTMSRIVDGLESEDYATRKQDKIDGRSTLVHPTTKGNKLLQDARKRRINDLARRLEKLSEEERQCLMKASGLIKEILSR
jgi:DNA-binding MarR family transcriptional regulator